ncbi:hypothetical protein HON01_11420 [Candidatus Woesearchaeota archaeon]|nr:hypothetical protein [Candidatus Woesearchaeota archaeon]
MQEIPPHEKISHFFQNLYLAEPFLSDYELFDSNLLIKKLKEKMDYRVFLLNPKLILWKY